MQWFITFSYSDIAELTEFSVVCTAFVPIEESSSGQQDIDKLRMHLDQQPPAKI